MELPKSFYIPETNTKISIDEKYNITVKIFNKHDLFSLLINFQVWKYLIKDYKNEGYEITIGNKEVEILICNFVWGNDGLIRLIKGEYRDMICGRETSFTSLNENRFIDNVLRYGFEINKHVPKDENEEDGGEILIDGDVKYHTHENHVIDVRDHAMQFKCLNIISNLELFIKDDRDAIYFDILRNYCGNKSKNYVEHCNMLYARMREEIIDKIYKLIYKYPKLQFETSIVDSKYMGSITIKIINSSSLYYDLLKIIKKFNE